MPRATTRAINFYKEALKHNADSVNALSRLASLYRDQDQLDQVKSTDNPERRWVDDSILRYIGCQVL